MSRAFTTSSDAIRYAAAIVGSEPFCVAVQFRCPGGFDGLQHVLWGTYEATTNDGFSIEISSGAGRVRAITKAAGASSGSLGEIIPNGLWHWAFCSWSSITNRESRLDLGAAVTDTASRDPGTLTKTLVGAGDINGTLGSNIGHYVAQVGIWSVSDMTDAERADIYYERRAVTAVRPTALLAHIDLRNGNVVDLLGNRSPSWTLFGPPLVADDALQNDEPDYFFTGFTLGQIKTVNGLAIANVKTMNSLARASIKTANGLTP